MKNSGFAPGLNYFYLFIILCLLTVSVIDTKQDALVHASSKCTFL